MVLLEVLEGYGPDAVMNGGVQDHVEQFHNEFGLLGEEVQFVGQPVVPQMTCRIEDLTLSCGNKSVVVLTVGKLTCLGDICGVIVTVAEEWHVQKRQAKGEGADAKEK